VTRRRAAVAIAALLAAGIFALARPRPRGVVAVEAGEIERRIAARASVAPAGGVARVRSQNPGVVKEVHARVGDVVEAGHVLARYVNAGTIGEISQITTPIAGTVIASRIERGDSIGTEGPALFEVADLSKLEARIEVDEAWAGQLSAGQPLVLRGPGGGTVVAEGRLERVGPVLEDRRIGAAFGKASGEGRVRAATLTLKAAPGLFAGQELEAVIVLPAIHVAARLPREAVRIEDGRAVIDTPGWLWPRTVAVTLGESDERFVAVTGVAVGEAVSIP